MEWQNQRLAILGLGLMGGSLGLASKRAWPDLTVAGYARRAETRDQALAGQVVDCVFDTLEDTVRGADLIVICAPVGNVSDLVVRSLAAGPAEAVITDVGSSKRSIVEAAESACPEGPVRFVGSHPIAGSEKQGLDAAQVTLYQDACVVLTPTPRTLAPALKGVRAFWKGLGCRVEELSPESHDRCLARTSHLPHLVASLLARCVGRDARQVSGRFCGSGFEDTTRVAGGDPRLWRDIVQSNRTAILDELDAFDQDVARLKQALRNEDWDGVLHLLEDGQVSRRELMEGKRYA